MRKAALVSICVVGFSLLGATGRGQEPGGFGGVQSFGFSTTYSPNSSHILLGDAEQRRVWTLGAEYKHLLHQGPRFRFEYEGSVMPLWDETDPTLIGTTFMLNGQVIVTTEPAQAATTIQKAFHIMAKSDPADGWSEGISINSLDAKMMGFAKSSSHHTRSFARRRSLIDLEFLAK